MSYDYLIIGQGLAGSCVALQLMDIGKKVMVVDNPSSHSSSMVAAGLYNPITGRKMVKTWKADVLFPYLRDFYKKWENEFNQTFLIEKNIYRPFWDLEEQNEWMAKGSQDEYLEYIERVHHSPKFPDQLHDQYGGLMLKNAGFVNLPLFISSVREHLISRQSYLQMKIDENAIQIADGVTYNELSAKRLIFCTGYTAASTRYFDWLPHRPVKGEVLEVEVENTPEVIYNRGVFILPKEDGKCRIGATYDQNDLGIEVTEKGKRALMNKLHKVYRVEYNISGQVAGIRPATIDRRPFVGIHPDNSTIGIFNGLGAKGVSLAPYYSGQFVDFLEGDGLLDKEVNISRFKSLYFDTEE